MEHLFIAILGMCAVLIILVSIYNIKYHKAKNQLKELETAQAQIAKLKKDYNSAKGARDKVMCDYNTLKDKIVVLEEDIPENRTPKYLGMKFQNEVSKYVALNEKSGKMYLQVLKQE